MKTLLSVYFETGDTDLPYWKVVVVVKSEDKAIDCEEIEDSFASFIDRSDDDLEFDEIVTEVMNASGYEWSFISDKIPECDNAYDIRI